MATTKQAVNVKVDIPSIKKINKLKKKFKFVSFFAGCGGSSTGYKMAGGDCLFANEFVPIAKEAYEANAQPTTIVSGEDIRKLDPKKLMKQLGLKRGELDLMDGSPPCKSFSTAGVRHEKWDKEVEYSEGIVQKVDDLFDEYVRMVGGFMPKVFVGENVVGMASGRALGFLHEAIDNFEKLGYEVDARIIDPSQLGAPQKRRRLIIIGVRKDIYKKLGLKSIPYPRPRKGVVTVADHLPHIVRIRVANGANTRFVPASIPHPTIMANDWKTSLVAIFSSGGWVEEQDGVPRRLTIDEVKTLMTFPKDYKLFGKYGQQFERLGRSHLPLATYHIGRTLYEQVIEPWNNLK